MDPLAALPQPVIDALARGWTVVTGNQRAARTLRHGFDLRQRALGSTHWQPAAVLAWDSWLGSLWRQALLDGHATQLLLNSTQEHALWRSVIAADPETSSLRPLDSLAELAAGAWSRLHAYLAHRRLHAAANTADTRAFARWAAEFERRCRRAEYITSAELPQAIAASISAGSIKLPPGILLVGFDQVSPAQTLLLNAVRATGAAVEELGLEAGVAAPLSSARQLMEAQDQHAELHACAHWLREQLTEDSAARLAVIVPDIDADRAAIDRVFRATLAPELEDIAAPAGAGPFEFSLGIPLDRTPIAAAALDILRWCAGPLSLDRVSALLLSPYFAQPTGQNAASAQDELMGRAEFDAFTLRNQALLEPRVTLEELASLASRTKSSTQITNLRTSLRVLTAAVRRAGLTRDRSHAEWAAIFHELLEAAGWAPVSHLDSVEFQARSKWESALDEFATLDFDAQAARVSFRAALDALTRIASQTLFAPESRHAPIQILGPLEAAGSSFDALWFLRAGDLTWPPVPSLHPLLPYSLQRDFGMPGTNVASDTTHALRVTRRIAASAPVAVFSYASQTQDGSQRSFPMLAELALAPMPAPSDDATPVPIALDRLLDTAPIPAPPSATLRGGAAILEAQAACAFRAFAERRLFSTFPDDMHLGLDARDRGSIVHAVLHGFWSEVQSQAALRAMTTAGRDALLAQCIDSALARDHSRPAAGWPSAYIDAERERLLRLLRPWLDFEANRHAPFVVVSQEEQLKDVRIGPLRLDIRVDRVDNTVPAAESGEAPGEIILDYKTGSADPAKWEGDRPDAPQLPLYAVVSPAPRLAAVAFASIRPGKDMGISGLQAEPHLLPGAKKSAICDLEAKRAEWRRVLTVLAEEFHAGHALAAPKDYPTTCRYCRQRLLCRLDLAALQRGEDSDDAADSFAAEGEALP